MSLAPGVNVRLMNAKVVCRIRPLSISDFDSGVHCCLDYTTKCIEVFTPSGQYPFYCDHTFDELSSQREVFDHCARPLALDALSGINSTIIAYGQTGSGKTYTIEGDNDDPLKIGIIPRTIAVLFDAAEERSMSTKYSIAISYIEIYMEKLKDLLTPEIVPIAGQERSVKIIGEKVCVKTISSYDQFVIYWTSGTKQSHHANV
jgi:kinesin family member 5